MRSCPACGTANREDDDFCGNCGSYLGWSTEPRRTPPEPEPEPERHPTPEPQPQPRPTPQAQPIPPTPAPTPQPEPEPEPTPTPTPTPTPPPEPTHPPRPSAAPSPPAPVRPTAPPTPPVRPAHPAQSTPTPTPEAEAEAPIGAVQPAKPVARRPVVRPVEEDEAPDGPPCPKCGTPNLPGRRFCRRCAAPLHPKEESAPLPWWRTVWPFHRRVRVRSGRVLRRILLVLAVVGLLFVGFLFLPAGRVLFEDVRDKLGGTAEISPSGVTASGATPGHPAGAAVDGLTNKYWGAPSLGASLTCTFGTPFRLVGVVLHTGASKEPEEFRREPRPIRAELIVTTADGTLHKKQLTLNDKPGEQTVRTGISDVVSVQLVLLEAAGRAEGRPIALGEVEFFKRT
ncbi:zinc ribbon domain-containing protein [Streptomyces sp. ME02-6991-2A]|nr:zinc ribbon domain-containing protein [Streptomyces sp. ME02-6991-2A]